MNEHDEKNADPDESSEAIASEPVTMEQLSRAFAKMLEQPGGDAPSGETPGHPDDSETETTDSASKTSASQGPENSDARLAVSPRGLIEAALFVGHENNQPLASQQIAAVMSGVDPREVDDLIRQLNANYAEQGCPYQIVHEDSGYRMVLREELDRVRDSFYGKMREIRLSQPAIDVLAIVAFNQPMTRDEVARSRGKQSNSLLLQLVRRKLLRVERTEESPRISRYYTADRFLDLFGLDNLDDLPRPNDLPRPENIDQP